MRVLSAVREVTQVVGIDPVEERRREMETAFPHIVTKPTLEDAIDAVDAVVVATKPSTHASLALRCMRAGKHVLVEKAIALETRDADAMVAAAKQSGKLLMVAHVLPFFPEFAFAAKVIREGTYGKLRGGHFKRVIAKLDAAQLEGEDPRISA